MNIKNVFDILTNMLYVKDIKCIYCNNELNLYNKYCLCAKCESMLPYNNERVCKLCGTKLFGEVDLCHNCLDRKNYYDLAFSVFTYSGLIKDLILRLKFGNQKWLSEYLSKFLLDKFDTLGLNIDLVIPVPMHKEKENLRGYNQALELCSSFKDRFEVRNDILIKHKSTKSQAESSFSDRKINLKDSFKCDNKQYLVNKSILLIDDIYTTGSTVNECSKVLRKCGVNKIYVLTLASTVYDSIKKIY